MNKLKEILKSLTILYAEDDETTRENISKTLSLFVKEVVTASNGSQAIKLFEKQKFQIVILDYLMPIMDGMSVAKHIRNIDKNIPILILSSYADKEKLISSIKTGINDYLEKPINFNELHDALENAAQRILDSNKLIIKLGNETYYDYIDKAITRDGQYERLTKNESLFLEVLIDSPNILVNKTIIEERIFKGEVEANALRNMIHRLRKKIPVPVIITIKDQGYMFCPQL